MPMSYQAIYPRVRNAIYRSLKGRVPIDEIRAGVELNKAPLRYDSEGVRALRGFILAEFEEASLRISDAEFIKVKSVRDIARLVNEKLGNIE